MKNMKQEALDFEELDGVYGGGGFTDAMKTVAIMIEVAKVAAETIENYKQENGLT